MVRKFNVSEIAAVIGRGGRSDLYLWMWDNFDEVMAARLGRFDWVGATKKFAAQGYTGRNGIPLTTESVRKTWSRVVADRAGRKVAPKRVEVTPPAITKPPVDPVPKQDDGIIEPGSRFGGRGVVSRFEPKGDD